MDCASLTKGRVVTPTWLLICSGLHLLCMACLLLLVVVLFPRIVLALLFFFSHYLDRAYHGLLIPLLGFFAILPLTTLALCLDGEHRPAHRRYLINRGSHRPGGLGGGEFHRRRR